MLRLLEPGSVYACEFVVPQLRANIRGVTALRPPSRLDAVTKATQPPSGTISIGGAHPANDNGLLFDFPCQSFDNGPWRTNRVGVRLGYIDLGGRSVSHLSSSAVGEGCIPTSATSPAARWPHDREA